VPSCGVAFLRHRLVMSSHHHFIVVLTFRNRPVVASRHSSSSCQCRIASHPFTSPISVASRWYRLVPRSHAVTPSLRASSSHQTITDSYRYPGPHHAVVSSTRRPVTTFCVILPGPRHAVVSPTRHDVLSSCRRHIVISCHLGVTSLFMSLLPPLVAGEKRERKVSTYIDITSIYRGFSYHSVILSCWLLTVASF
jgi:hypothetical protein